MLSPEDRKGINAIRSTLRDAILNGDPEAYVNCYKEDGVVIHPDSPLVRGREALTDYANKIFAGLRVTDLVFTSLIVEGADGVAYEVGTQELTVEPADPRFKAQRQHLLVYERQDDGTWKVAAGMSGNQ